MLHEFSLLVASIFHLRQKNTLLGTLKQSGLDFPWISCTFEPTESFNKLKPLFDRELELTESEEWDEWEEAYQQIEAEELYIVEVAEGKEIHEFLLHIRGAEAWFRF